ncbi:MAG: adenine/guanine/hypoxanthine permease [Solirubrobacteraceae bacterium]|jgi:AGZA family xanthine/uracil permease-like MFS transporter|nr:adenine/guanine/hypoxanthine permease [Solirubrobacteraceae bacterium]
MSAIAARFAFADRGTTLRTEVLGGVATFLTMSYIVFVNPAFLSAAGLPFEAVAVCTALGAAFFTALMGLVTNMPFALASGLGLNAVVAFDLILGRKLAPGAAMACILIEGLIAVALVLGGLREAVVRAVPASLKLSIGVGIGLFITLVGLREGGITVNSDATGIGLGDLSTGPPLVALGGILAAIVVSASGRRGAILVGVFTALALGLIFGVLDGPDGVTRMPHGSDFDIVGDAVSGDALGDALTVSLIPVIFTLFMTDFFDTVGTAYAVGTAGGLVDAKGELGRAGDMKRVLLVDSAAAAGGGLLGVSSITTYVESGAGVSEGARTGFASLVTAGLFVLCIFFVPVIALVGQEVSVGDASLHPAVAPALVMVGYLMLRLVQSIDWNDPSAAIPCFLIIVGVPMTFSISAGIGFGVIGYVAVMVAQRRAREVSALMWVLVPLFIAFFESTWLEKHVF